MDNNDQRNLSEQLQLLHELQYSDSSGMPHQSHSGYSNRMSRDTSRDARLLDTIAVALTTGNPGEVFAAAFDKREQMQLVLAKNGPPTPDDIAAAREFFSLIGSPAILSAVDIFPFLIRRCVANINKRIHNLHTFIQDGELRNDFTLALEAYPGGDINAEFPGADGLLGDYGDVVPPFATVWGNFVEDLADITAQGLDAGDASSAATYAYIFLVADALACSRFLKTLMKDRNLHRKGRAEKLKRRLNKVRQYASGTAYLIEKAKRLFPIPHRWVTDTFTGTGECVFDLCNNPYDAISRGLHRPSLSPEIVDKLDKHFPSILNNWQRQQTMHTCIHAELRLILHFGLPSGIEHPVCPIGASKRSCFCCTFWIEAHNRMFETQWMASRSHGKPHANWALPGAACSYDGTSSLDKAVLQAVSVRLTNALDSFSPQVSTDSDDESEQMLQ
jgi:hypothetical protein